jgi:hypothetical protein
VAQHADHPPGQDADHPRHWLGASPLFDLEDSKLRLRVRAITQLCLSERDKVLAVYRYVKKLPLVRRVRLRSMTAPQVIDAGAGDATAKATLLVAMLRAAGVPARMRWVLLRGEILRGLVPGRMQQAMRPLVEAWLDGRWIRTDTYIFDAGYMAAARQRLRDERRAWGYGIHVNGAMVWDACTDAFVSAHPTEADPMVVADLGAFHDVLQFRDSPAFRLRHRPLARLLRWNLLAPLMQLTIRRLRRDQSHLNHVTGRGSS